MRAVTTKVEEVRAVEVVREEVVMDDHCDETTVEPEPEGHPTPPHASSRKTSSSLSIRVTVLNALHVGTLVLPRSCEGSSPFHSEAARHREVKWLAQDHTALGSRSKIPAQVCLTAGPTQLTLPPSPGPPDFTPTQLTPPPSPGPPDFTPTQLGVRSGVTGSSWAQKHGLAGSAERALMTLSAFL